jgi:hypothetical protein
VLVIESFPRRRTTRRPGHRTEHFASRRRVREAFDAFWEAYPSRHPHSNPKHPAQVKFETKVIRRGVDPADIIRGARNYASYVSAHVRDPRLVAMAQTWLYQERWTDHQEEFAPPPTTDEVVSSVFNGSAVLAASFRSDVLVRARKLDMGRVSEPDLAARLGELYQALRAERAPGSDTPGSLDLLGRYVDWLSEKDWRMTPRVLGMDSPAFAQFRREEASRHPHGVDPLTGR